MHTDYSVGTFQRSLLGSAPIWSGNPVAPTPATHHTDSHPPNSHSHGHTAQHRGGSSTTVPACDGLFAVPL